jgi:hypothetical protein
LVLEYIRQIESSLTRTFKDVDILMSATSTTRAIVTALRSQPSPKNNIMKKVGDIIYAILDFFEKRPFAIGLVQQILQQKFDPTTPQKSFLQTIKKPTANIPRVVFVKKIIYYVKKDDINVETRNENLSIDESSNAIVDALINNKSLKNVDRDLLENSFEALRQLAPYIKNTTATEFQQKIRDRVINEWLKQQDDKKMHVIFAGSEIGRDNANLSGFFKNDNFLSTTTQSIKNTDIDAETFTLSSGQFIYTISTNNIINPIAAEYNKKDAEWWRTLLRFMMWESNDAELSCKRVFDKSLAITRVVIQYTKNDKITMKGQKNGKLYTVIHTLLTLKKYLQIRKD